MKQRQAEAMNNAYQHVLVTLLLPALRTLVVPLAANVRSSGAVLLCLTEQLQCNLDLLVPALGGMVFMISSPMASF